MLGFALRTLSQRRPTTLDPHAIAAIRERRFRRLLRAAMAGSPFHAELYRGLDPDRCALADLPPTNKAMLMARFDETVTDRAITREALQAFVDRPDNEGRPFLGRYAVSHTSGSQGQPMLLVQPLRVLELLYSLQMTRGNARKPSLTEAVRRFTAPARLAIVTLKRGFYPSASTFEYMPDAARRFMKILWLSQTDPDVLDRLNAYRPTVLTGYAAVLDQLALEAEAGRLRLAPELQQVTNNSEVLSERTRDRIRSAFGLHAINNYATGECPFLTNGCRTDAGAHVNADWAILEVVDADNRPVPDGTPGAKVLITNLANTVQPIVRYEIGDVVTMATEPCGCGNRLPRVERIEGRTADVFWIWDGTRYRSVINCIFKNGFDYLHDVREWQAVQTGRNAVLVRLEPLPGTRLDLARARAVLHRQLAMYDLVGLLDVTIEPADRLGPDPRTGKFRRIISLVGPPPDGEAAPGRRRAS
jgi:phenylacetate-coenzyme A ligase PaaK-like adenylate-forming protein